MTDGHTGDAPAPVPTGVELTALDPAFRADPYPVLARLREREPVHHDQEIVGVCELPLAAGNVSTTDLIGTGIWLLLRHPDQLQKLRDDPALIANAVEEMLRFESPVVQTVRIPMGDLEIGGCPIRRASP